MTKWMKFADKINRTIQTAASVMTKEAQQNNPGATYVLNSYAFHSRPLINTLLAYLPAGFEKGKVEAIFTESTQSDLHGDILLLSENTEKIRKRALISSTYATAYRVKHFLRVFKDLRAVKALAPSLYRRSQGVGLTTATNLTASTTITREGSSTQPQPATPALPYQQRQFRKGLENTLANLVAKYDPTGASNSQNKKSQVLIPSIGEPARKPKNLDPDDFSDDEQYYKHRAQVIRYKSWRYSLLCKKNIVRQEQEVIDSPHKDSPQKVSRQGLRSQASNAIDLHLGRSPNLQPVKRGVPSRLALPNSNNAGDNINRTVSPNNNLQVGQAAMMRRTQQQTKSGGTGTAFNHISHDPPQQRHEESCPMHQNRQQRSQIGLNQIDLGGGMGDQDNATNGQSRGGFGDTYSSHVESAEVLVLPNEKGPERGKNAKNAAKASFGGQQRIMNPFKQDRKKLQQQRQLMTINGRIRNGNAKNGQKAIVYDPKIIAHMAKMYMMPNQAAMANQIGNPHKKSLFPQHVQQQLLLQEDQPSSVYNRTNNNQNSMTQRAVEDLIQKKIMFHANNAQQLYSHIYNTDVQILCTEQGRLQYQRELTSKSSTSAMEKQPAHTPAPQAASHATPTPLRKKVVGPRTSSVLVGSVDNQLRAPYQHTMGTKGQSSNDYSNTNPSMARQKQQAALQVPCNSRLAKSSKKLGQQTNIVPYKVSRAQMAQPMSENCTDRGRHSQDSTLQETTSSTGITIVARQRSEQIQDQLGAPHSAANPQPQQTLERQTQETTYLAASYQNNRQAASQMPKRSSVTEKTSKSSQPTPQMDNGVGSRNLTDQPSSLMGKVSSNPIRSQAANNNFSSSFQMQLTEPINSINGQRPSNTQQAVSNASTKSKSIFVKTQPEDRTYRTENTIPGCNSHRQQLESVPSQDETLALQKAPTGELTKNCQVSSPDSHRKNSIPSLNVASANQAAQVSKNSQQSLMQERMEGLNRQPFSYNSNQQTRYANHQQRQVQPQKQSLADQGKHTGTQDYRTSGSLGSLPMTELGQMRGGKDSHPRNFQSQDMENSNLADKPQRSSQRQSPSQVALPSPGKRASSLAYQKERATIMGQEFSSSPKHSNQPIFIMMEESLEEQDPAMISQKMQPPQIRSHPAYIDNCTSKLHRIKKSKPLQNSSPLGASRNCDRSLVGSQLSNKSSSSPKAGRRPNNSKPRARSRSKQILKQECAMQPANSSMQQSQAFASQQTQKTPTPMSRRTPVKPQASYNSTKPKQQLPAHITHQLDVTSPTQQELRQVPSNRDRENKSRLSDMSQPISRIYNTATNKSRSQTRKKTQTQGSTQASLYTTQLQQQEQQRQVTITPVMPQSEQDTQTLQETFKQHLASQASHAKMSGELSQHTQTMIKRQEGRQSQIAAKVNTRVVTQALATSSDVQPGYTMVQGLPDSKKALNKERQSSTEGKPTNHSVYHQRKISIASTAETNLINPTLAQATQPQQNMGNQMIMQKQRTTTTTQEVKGQRYQPISDKTQALLNYQSKIGTAAPQISGLTTAKVASNSVNSSQLIIQEQLKIIENSSRQSTAQRMSAAPTIQQRREPPQGTHNDPLQPQPATAVHRISHHPAVNLQSNTSFNNPQVSQGSRRLRDLPSGEVQPAALQQVGGSMAKNKQPLRQRQTSQSYPLPGAQISNMGSSSHLGMMAEQQTTGTATSQRALGAGAKSEETRPQGVTSSQRPKVMARQVVVSSMRDNQSKAFFNQDYIDSTAPHQRRQSSDPYHIQKMHKINGIQGARQSQAVVGSRHGISLPTSNLNTQRQQAWAQPGSLQASILNSPDQSLAGNFAKTTNFSQLHQGFSSQGAGSRQPINSQERMQLPHQSIMQQHRQRLMGQHINTPKIGPQNMQRQGPPPLLNNLSTQ